MQRFRSVFVISWMLAASLLGWGQAKRKVIIDQDAMGPGGTDQDAILVLIQSPDVDPLGITVVTGDGWRDEEVAHTLRMLEIIGRTDIPVVPGAVFPLVNSKEGIEQWEKRYGKIPYMGAWFVDYAGWKYHDPFIVPPLKEGSPTTKPANEDAAHFMVRMVHKYPHQVTIYAAGPLTDLALAMGLDPQFPALTKDLVVMGGSMNPSTTDPEYLHSPQREFNFWFDPEATHKVLHGAWPKMTCTTVDISVKTSVTRAMIDEIARARTPVAQYVSKYAYTGGFMWDELAAAAWVDPGIITKEEMIYMDADVDHGAGYGNTLSWVPGTNPGLGEQLVHVQRDLDTQRLYRLFVRLMTGPTPDARTTGDSRSQTGGSGAGRRSR
ncbi:MAG TPA: nucleoside hydrolase [Terriglobia bacterium]|nr:nucleoside hydrolase [Terriglobia bacterium]